MGEGKQAELKERSNEIERLMRAQMEIAQEALAPLEKFALSTY